MNHRPFCYLCWILFGLLLFLPGCTSVSETFPDHPANQVWPAMIATAENPQYPDWRVAENNLWVDEDNLRIEVDRHLRREYFSPDSNSRRETQHWKFQILLEQTDPPEATFISRGFGIPMQARREGERYFVRVKELLLGLDPQRTTPPPTTPPQRSVPPPPGQTSRESETSEQSAPIDIDDLEVPQAVPEE